MREANLAAVLLAVQFFRYFRLQILLQQHARNVSYAWAPRTMAGKGYGPRYFHLTFLAIVWNFFVCSNLCSILFLYSAICQPETRTIKHKSLGWHTKIIWIMEQTERKKMKKDEDGLNRGSPKQTNMENIFGLLLFLSWVDDMSNKIVNSIKEIRREHIQNGGRRQVKSKQKQTMHSGKN